MGAEDSSLRGTEMTDVNSPTVNGAGETNTGSRLSCLAGKTLPHFAANLQSSILLG